jgi:hypothetical protein
MDEDGQRESRAHSIGEPVRLRLTAQRTTAFGGSAGGTSDVGETLQQHIGYCGLAENEEAQVNPGKGDRNYGLIIT